MIIFPGFTWEYLIEFFEAWRTNYQKQVDTFESEIDTVENEVDTVENEVIKQYLMRHVQIGQGSIDLVSKLRGHPGIEKYVPRRGMWLLSWSLDKDSELSVQSLGNKDEYHLSFDSGKAETEWSVVTLDEVADRVYAYIRRFE